MASICGGGESGGELGGGGGGGGGEVSKGTCPERGCLCQFTIADLNYNGALINRDQTDVNLCGCCGHRAGFHSQQDRSRGNQKPLPRSFVPANSQDIRPKSLFTITKLGDHKEDQVKVDAVLMSDTGSGAGLTIPARKAIEMGLTPINTTGAKRRGKGAGNETFTLIMLKPQVKLEVKFSRPDGTEDRKVCVTNAWCHEDEYLKCLEKPNDKSQALGSKQTKTRVTSPTVSFKSESASENSKIPTSPSLNKNIAGIIPLKEISPIRHRSDDHPEDRATIGMIILYEMGIHINCKTSQLEIEEEHIFYEEETII